MDLDEQLAALAAGELDDDTARALRARAATDPAIARRLARHHQLQRVLEGWEAPAMSAEAAARLDERIDEALAALGDGPLSDEGATASGPRLRPLPDTADEQDASTPGGAAVPTSDGNVVDLGEARRRRGLPSWVPGAAVAAALVAVVGTGIVMGGFPGGTSLDTVAGEAEDATEEAAQDEAADAAGTAADGAARLEADDGPMRMADVEVAEGDLLALVDTSMATTQSFGSAVTDDEAPSDTAGGDDTAAAEDTEEEAAPAPEAMTAAPADAPCVTEALERDTAAADGRDVWLVATGTYAEEPAVFVVVRTPATPEDRFEVLAYDPDGCTLLARDQTTR